jgi:dihydrolipoamide dehydrogenase
MSERYDLVVIGAGPGGYVAALQAARLGLKVACIEKDRLGGVCLNVGCIPSKALLKSAEYANTARHLGDWGIEVGEVKVDFPGIVQRSRKVADTSEKGVRFLFKKRGVTAIFGTAKILAAGRVQVSTEDGEQTLECTNIIVATGARARWFDGMVVDGERVQTYKEVIVSQEQPGSIIVLGAGAIGLEFAYFFNAMGTTVTLIEGAERICPLEEPEVSKALHRSFKKQGITIKTSTMCSGAAATAEGAEVMLADGETLSADRVLLALGVRPNTEDLGLEDLGIALHKGFIQVDSSFCTSVPGIYAIGDVAGPPCLAHKAIAEAHLCVERIAGHTAPDLDPLNMPSGIYCVPQVASVGHTEGSLKEQGIPYTVGKYPFAANGKNRGTGATEGFVKVLIDPEFGELLGAHLIGDNATELLAELVLAKRGEVDALTFARTIHSHPTSSEAVLEAVSEAIGVGVHL